MGEKIITLNIAGVNPATCALGPGLRAVVWVQGCHFQCAGCIAPQWKPFITARLVRVDQLAEELLVHPEVGGFTFSGGEPMLQAAGLAQLIRIARRQRDLTLICYTGYRLDQLRRTSLPGVEQLLAETDVLIDGVYVEKLNNNKGLRGSVNQQVHHLTNRLKFFDFENSPRRIEIKIEDGFITLTGIPSTSVLNGYHYAVQNSRFPSLSMRE